MGGFGVSGRVYMLRAQRAQDGVASSVGTKATVVILTATPLPSTATSTPTNTPQATPTGTPVLTSKSQDASKVSNSQVVTKIVAVATATTTPAKIMTATQNITATADKVAVATLSSAATPTTSQATATPTAQAIASNATAVTVNTPTSAIIKTMPVGGGILPNGKKFLIGAGVATLCLIILGLFTHTRRSA